MCIWGFSSGSVVKNLPATSGNMCVITEAGRSTGEGNGSSLQRSCLGNQPHRECKMVQPLW